MSEIKHELDGSIYNLGVRQRIGLYVAACTLASLSFITGQSSVENTEEPLVQASETPNAAAQETFINDELLAAQEQLNYLSAIIAAQVGVNVETVNRDLDAPESLPGYGLHVSPELKAQLEGSVVQLAKRQKGTQDPWTEGCSANKVSFGNESYILTAAHCVNGYLPFFLIDNKGGNEGEDITDLSGFEYSIFKPNIPPTFNPDLPIELSTVSPLATVTKLAIIQHTTDIALLHVEGTLPEFEQLPALNMPSETPMPTIGVEVEFNSLPQANNHERVTATGVYLGRIYDGHKTGSLSEVIDVVGISNIAAMDEDPCMYGASGSAAMTADGIAISPLSNRHQVSPYMNGSSDEIEDAQTLVINTLKNEDALGVDASKFDVLCSYSVLQPGDLDALLNPSIAIAVETSNIPSDSSTGK